MTENNIKCLICGEEISLQINLSKFTISTDCKNKHHFREMPLNDYFQYLNNHPITTNHKNNQFTPIFYCFNCQENIPLSNIQLHNGHNGIKLTMDEFLTKEETNYFNKKIIGKNLDIELEKISKIINDFEEWKKEFDIKYDYLLSFYKNLLKFEKNYLTNLNENFNYENLINIKEILRINNELFLAKRNYEGLFNKNNFNKINYYIMNKIHGISDNYSNSFNNIDNKINLKIYYEGNNCFFNEEIKYKNERKENLFPALMSLIKNSKGLDGLELRYFKDNNLNEKYTIENLLLDEKFQKLLQTIKNDFVNINHFSQMRNKSDFICSVLNRGIIILHTNILDFNKNNINSNYNYEIIDSFSNMENEDTSHSLELTNNLIVSISKKYIYIWETLIDIPETKQYFINKKIKIKNKIDDIIQVTNDLFCTYSLKLREIHFYDIKNLELILKMKDFEGTTGNSRYMTMINEEFLFFGGAEKIYLISVKDFEIRKEITTTGLISSFCLLNNNCVLCGEIIFDYSSNNPYNRESNKYNLVQYQINAREFKRISVKEKVHNDIIRTLIYFKNNFILSYSNSKKDPIKIWY